MAQSGALHGFDKSGLNPALEQQFDRGVGAAGQMSAVAGKADVRAKAGLGERLSDLPSLHPSGGTVVAFAEKGEGVGNTHHADAQITVHIVPGAVQYKVFGW